MILAGQPKARVKSNPTQPRPKLGGFCGWLTAQDRAGVADRDAIVRPIRGKLFHS